MKNSIIQIPIILLLIVLVLFGTYAMEMMERIPASAESGKTTQESERKADKAASIEETTTVEVTTRKAVNLTNKLKKSGFTAVKGQETDKPVTDEQGFNITLSFVGDCLLATNHGQYYANCFNEVADREDASYFFAKTAQYFTKDDFTIGDCENVFSDSDNLGISDKGQYENPNVEAYWFKSKSANAEILAKGGVDMVSISNNHINDYGNQGHIDTQAALDAAGVEWGEEGKIIYHEKNGYKIAVICASMYGTYAVDGIKEYIDEASAVSDFQILYFHGGTEAVHEPEGWKIQACHDLIDAGCDLVIGDHPHVLQPMEEYNGAVIIYSMGNFIFGGNRHPENRTVIYQHAITVKNGEAVSQAYKIIPCYVYVGDMNNWQPDVISDDEQKSKVLNFMNGKESLPY